MNRIDGLFKTDRKVLSVFLTAGYPRLNDTVPLCQALEDSGADMLEIGIPFSDPVADGPTIQAASGAAIGNGMTVARLLDDLKRLREKVAIPVLLMGYLNPVLQFGVEKFAAAAKECGVDGLIFPDLPLDEYEREYAALFARYDLRMVLLVTSRTPADRVRRIDAASNGFLYIVSSEATTGGSSGVSEATRDYLRTLASLELRNPCIVGFGIHDKSTYDEACRYARGAIVGSAFIRAISSLPADAAESQKSEVAALQFAVNNFVKAFR